LLRYHRWWLRYPARSPSAIIIEKVEKSRSGRKSRDRNSIRNGDMVMFARYQRAKTARTKNSWRRYLPYIEDGGSHGLEWLQQRMDIFTIRNFMRPTSVKPMVVSLETRRLVTLTLGGSFWLQHKRWKKCLVGVARNWLRTAVGIT
jgi:hypothetical protein